MTREQRGPLARHDSGTVTLLVPSPPCCGLFSEDRSPPRTPSGGRQCLCRAMGPGAGCLWGRWLERGLSAAGQQQERAHASLLQDAPVGAPLVSPPGWASGKRDRALSPRSAPRLSGLASDPITPSDCKEIFGIEGLFWFVLESGRNENWSEIQTEAGI